jgi:hypothetical protein
MRAGAHHAVTDIDGLRDALAVVGGRLAYISRVAKARDVAAIARHLLDLEKAWLLSQIGLIPDLDDDVMDEVMLHSCSEYMHGINTHGFSKNGAHARGCFFASSFASDMDKRRNGKRRSLQDL